MEILVKDLLEKGKMQLMEAGVNEYDHDAFSLAEHIFGISRHEFYMNRDIAVSKSLSMEYMKCISMRASGVPMQYIKGYAEFMGLSFFVSKDVLIPRQDTEILVDHVSKYISDLLKRSGKAYNSNEKIEVLDVCTGSGCIAISLGHLFPDIKVTASDVSKRALSLAERNSDHNNTEVTFVLSDMFENIDGAYDIIVSNPPYIKTEDIPNLQREVRDYDPFIALDGGTDGLNFYRIIASEAAGHLKKNGRIFLEIGWDQAKEVECLLRENEFKNIKVYKDMAGFDRVMTAGRE